MAYRGVTFFVGEALKSIWRNGLMTFASLTTVTGCLLLFGIFVLFSVNMNYIGEQIQAQCELQASLNLEIEEAEARRIMALIKDIDGVSRVELETRQQAYENLKRWYGDEVVALDGLDGDNFLPNSIKINMDNISNSDRIAAAVTNLDGVDSVINRKDLMDRINSVTHAFRSVTFYMTVILAVISVFIISNTIKLAVFAREREIHIMKYVGATDWFIRWPFLIEGVIVGAIGGGTALLIVCWGYGAFVSGVTSYLDIVKFRPLPEILSPIVSLLLGFGAVMGAIGSVVAIRRHLKV